MAHFFLKKKNDQLVVFGLKKLNQFLLAKIGSVFDWKQFYTDWAQIK